MRLDSDAFQPQFLSRLPRGPMASCARRNLFSNDNTNLESDGGGFQKCRDPGSNRGPSDLQSDALPTELSRQWFYEVNFKPARRGRQPPKSSGGRGGKRYHRPPPKMKPIGERSFVLGPSRRRPCIPFQETALSPPRGRNAFLYQGPCARAFVVPHSPCGSNGGLRSG